MNEDGIVRICNAFGLKFGRAYLGTATWGAHMSIACPLAVKNHGDHFDDNMSCSVEVVDGGPSRVKCWSGNCRFKGKLSVLVRTGVKMRGDPPDLVDMLAEVEKLESVSLSGQLVRERQRLAQAHGPADSKDWCPPIRDRELVSEKLFEDYAGKIPQYAIERGITVETAKAWGLGYDKEAAFLVFPVRRSDGGLVGLVGRAVSDRAKRKHQNYMGLDKSKHLYGVHMWEPNKPVVVVESCIDTLNTWQALEGEANVGATLGEGFSAAHALAISIVRPPFVYVFTDGDPAGRLMAAKIAYALNQKKIPTRIMECPWGPIIEATADGRPVRQKIDPTNLPYSHIRTLFDEAKLVIGGKIPWTTPPPYFDPSETV